MSQPDWKIVGLTGDVNPVEYGGGWILVDTTGVYDPELEYYEPELKRAYRVMLVRQAEIEDGVLVDASVLDSDSRPYPLSHYESWFSENLDQPAACCGMSVEDLRRLLCSKDPAELAEGYMCLVYFYGWEEFDGYPLELTQEQAEKRYRGWKIGKTFHVGNS